MHCIWNGEANLASGNAAWPIVPAAFSDTRLVMEEVETFDCPGFLSRNQENGLVGSRYQAFNPRSFSYRLAALGTDVPLHQTCKSLHEFSTTRPVYRNLAHALLKRCRALPLKGFQRLSDLTTEQLILSVNKASQYEESWRKRAPRPITVAPFTDALPSSSAMSDARDSSWYKVVTAPPGEEVDWLSPITSSYTLCATKSGKVVCWDVQTDRCLAEWNPGERWELWKCRVEFEDRTVFFTMAKVVSGT